MKYASLLLALGCLVTAVNAQWLETTIQLDSGSTPWALCYNPQDNKVYCANWGGGDVTVIDGATNQILATVTVGLYPEALCYNPQNNKVYCANNYDGNVTVIDGATDSVLVTIAVGDRPIALCHNPAQNRVYVSNSRSASISVLRDSGGGIEESPRPQASSVKLAPTVLRRLPSSAVAFDASGRRVTNPKSGIYFVRAEPSAASRQPSAVAVRKVILQR